MTTFLKLSEDVQRLVFDLLGTKSLYAMCLVHRRIRQLAEEFLYANINLAWGAILGPGRGGGGGGDDDDSDHNNDNDDDDEKLKRSYAHPIKTLLRTLLHRPGLARLVRRLYCDCDMVNGKDRQSEVAHAWYLHLSGPPLEEAITLVKQARLPYGDVWLEALRSSRIDAYIALLFTQLPRVRQLEFTQDVFIETELLNIVLGSLLASGSPQQHPLPPFTLPGSLLNVTTVILSRKHRPSRIRAKNFAIVKNAYDRQFFHLPLEQLTLDLNLIGGEDIWPAGTQPPPSNPRLSRLKLYARETQLEHIFLVTPRLKEFFYQREFWGSEASRRSKLIIDLDVIIPALLKLKETLTVLDLRAEAIDWYSYQRFQLKGSVRGLAELSLLKVLNIPLTFVAGFDMAQSTIDIADCLPPHLESLTLGGSLYRAIKHYPHDTLMYSVDSLIPWLTTVGETSANLRTICFDFLWSRPRHPSDV
ncbi:hypothetical protein QBC37DRAFT_377728 [Rhypophila decipiens]|uniref:F-box domain-containing protein n=1 Tax=Rhypophila decipiens TaxID=261697 RepID=A0AAN7B6B4_9PEZI|nr:hypothetical protein QBC37DRAFT_377728 [Rhypophila decipiens]